MRKFYFIFLLVVFNCTFSQNLDWFYLVSKEKETPSLTEGINRPYSMAVDADESVYLGGLYTGKIGFNEQVPLDFHIQSNNNQLEEKNCYLVKLDKFKKYVWSKTISRGKDGLSIITGIVVDSEQNIIVTGYVVGKNVNLNPDSSNPVIYNTDDTSPNSGMFVNKYSKDGAFIFGKYYLGAHGNKVTVDKSDNIILTGRYLKYGNFNTNFDLSGSYYLTASQGSSFILKNDKNGNFLWAKSISGHNGTVVSGVKTDSKDNIIFTGNNEAFFSFNGEQKIPTLTINNEDYVAKINKDGAFLWFQHLGSNIFPWYNNENFDIDSDNSVVVMASKTALTLPFPNKNLVINDTNHRALLIKMDENRNYLWHSSFAQTEYSQQVIPTSVFISDNHIVNWTIGGDRIYKIYDKDENVEEIKGWVHFYNYHSKAFKFHLKFNENGKLIYNKYKLSDHEISRYDNKGHKLYLAGSNPETDTNPDQSIINPPITHENNFIRGNSFIQKLDKCYSGTPDGDPFAYFCSKNQNKIKDLYPKTSYSTWYDSPTSNTPLSPETVLVTKKYYATTTDVSCPENLKRLEVDVRISNSLRKTTEKAAQRW